MIETFQISNGDVIIDRTGQPTMVADALKLKQDVLENLTIATQDTGFGAGLDSLIGKLGDEFSLRAEISRRVRAAIGAQQQLQLRFHKSERPLNERIARVRSIIVSSVNDKKTTFTFKVDVVSSAGSAVGVGVALG